jgi:parallel beta-helix repeat protein
VAGFVLVRSLVGGSEPEPVVEGVGPHPGIGCPDDAIRVEPGESIQEAVGSNPVGAAFCLAAGRHRPPAPITPKTGQSFTGEHGAVIDGSALPDPDDSNTGIFRCHNQDIDDVEIRNLVLRGAPGRGVHAHVESCDRWLVEHNEIAGNRYGVSLGHDAVVSANHIHSNAWEPDSPIPARRGGAYGNFQADRVRYEGNEIGPGNGPEQKVVQSSGTVFQDNTVHGNLGDGIWYDGDNTESLVEGNYISGNGRAGIHYEISGRGLIRDNVVEDHAFAGIFISSSHEVEVVANRLRDNGRGLWLFADRNAILQDQGWDLRDNVISENRVALVSGTAAYVSCAAATAAQCEAYAGQDNRFEGNRYLVRDPGGWWWFWVDRPRTWPQWRELGQDRDGAVEVG